MRLFAGALILFAQPAVTQEAEPQTDWQMVCDDANGCRMANLFEANGALVSRILIYPVQDANIVEVLLPLGLSHIAPPFIEVDENSKFPLQFLTCDEQGCILFAPKGDEVIAAFRRGLEAKVKFVGFKETGEFHYPFSLIGFTAVNNQYREGNS